LSGQSIKILENALLAHAKRKNKRRERRRIIFNESTYFKVDRI